MIYFYFYSYTKNIEMKKYWRKITLLIVTGFISLATRAQNGIIVLQTDFGMKDGAVAAMKGVILQTEKELRVFDLTHEIPVYNIWEAALRLEQTAKYWPKGTVFISVVDPGVGSSRKAVVLKTKNGYYFIGPDNGSFTFIAEQMGIAAIREIDETRNRLPGAENSHTFHGRDIFAYTGAKLASGKIKLEDVGVLLPPTVTKLPYQKPVLEHGIVKGTVTILDVQYGNVWSNISELLIKKAGIQLNDTVEVTIYHQNKIVFTGMMPYVNTFSAVAEGQPLGYINSSLNFSVAVNLASFAQLHGVRSGPEWRIELKKAH
jgi:S-adenosylmethionine hydrolase